MNAYKKLLKNSGIFAIANIGSKIITIILVPFYTYVLTTEQYGIIDMVMISTSMLLPIITLSIFDATLRFAVKSQYTKKEIFTSSLVVVGLGNVIFLLFYPILKKRSILSDYVCYFYMIVLFQTINQVIAQFVRGIGKVKIFAINGVINTFITVMLNIILLSWVKMGVKGYFISVLIANIVCTGYLMMSTKLWVYFSFNDYYHKLTKEMLVYSIPLIPNALMWWIMNASDRYIITLFFGVSANGLYAVANKVPSILNVLYSIFSQSWQLTAIEESNSKKKAQFYTNVFNAFSSMMLIIVSIVLCLIRPVVELLFANDFNSIWKYVPFLLLAVVFTSFSSFLGINYIVMKKTQGIFKTSLIGAILNIILNIFMIPNVGLNGAAIATMISFLSVWIMRIYDTKKFVKIKLDIKQLTFNISLVFFQITILYINNIIISFIVQLIIVLLIIISNKRLIMKFTKNLNMNTKGESISG